MRCAHFGEWACAQVKKALKADDGSFRAAFEDKVLRSDLIVLRAWVPVPLPTMYNPITSLLVPSTAGGRTGYLRMRTTGEARASAGEWARASKLHAPLPHCVASFGTPPCFLCLAPSFEPVPLSMLRCGGAIYKGLDVQAG